MLNPPRYPGWWFQPLWKMMSSSVGIILPNIWKVVKVMFQNVPNHQPVMMIYIIYITISYQPYISIYITIISYNMSVSENSVPLFTQWFCWSLSLFFMAISLGIYPIFRQTHMMFFPTFFPLGHQPTSPSSEVTANISRSSWANLAREDGVDGGRTSHGIFVQV